MIEVLLVLAALYLLAARRHYRALRAPRIDAHEQRRLGRSRGWSVQSMRPGLGRARALLAALTPARLTVRLAQHWHRISDAALRGAIMRAPFAPVAMVHTAMETFDVTGYGAKGDGSTNDTTAIQAAVTAAGAAGGEVYFPPGTYIIATSIATAGDNTILRGAGPGATVLKAHSTLSGRILSITHDFCTVRGFTLHGDDIAGTVGLGITSAIRLWVSDLYVNDCGSHGVLVSGVDGNWAHANRFSDIMVKDCGGYGFYVGAYAYDQEVTNLWVGQCANGVRVESANCFFTNLHSWGNTGDGFQARANDLRLTSVYLETNGSQGLDVFECSRLVVVGGNLWDNGAQGANFVTATYCTVVGLVVQDNTGGGIGQTDSTHVTIASCKFLDTQTPKTQTYGCTSSGTSDYTLIVGCSLLATDHLTGSTNLSGSNNRILGCAGIADTPKADIISEYTAAAGVTIDSVKLKDGYVVPSATAGEANAFGATGNAAKFHDGTAARTLATLETAQTFSAAKTFSTTPLMDAIAEASAAAGVTIDSVLLKDGTAKLTAAPLAAAGTLGWDSGPQVHDGSAIRRLAAPDARTVPGNSIETAYQISATRDALVTVGVNIALTTGQSCTVQALCDTNNPPTTVVDDGFCDAAPAAGTSNFTVKLVALVKAGEYLKITKSAGTGTATIRKWQQTIL